MLELKIGDDTLTLSWDEWEARVRAGRVPPTALVRFEPATGEEWVPAGQLELYQSLRNDAALAWRSDFSSAPPLLTALLVGVQVKLWWMAWWSRPVQDWMIVDLTLFTPAILEDGQVWRILTMGLAHQAAFHLFMNMLWLFYCGWNLERVLGRVNLAVIFFGSVLAGSLLSMFGDPSTPSLGASGGVYGLVTASIVFGFARSHLLPERGRRLFGWALVPYLVVMFASGLASEGTDNWSHLGGLVAGALLGVVLDPPALERRANWNRLWYGLVGGVAVGAFLLFGLAGPRIHPLSDSESARSSRARPDAQPTTRSLSWAVPVGWRPGSNPVRSLGFASPAGNRSWSVEEREHDRPTTAETERTTWLVTVQERWPTAKVELLDDALLHGEPALGARVHLSESGKGDRLLDYRVRARGLFTLEATWEVEAAMASRLAPLERRLRTRVVWEEPPGLRSARIHFEHNPESPKARDGMATELARVGQVEQALAIRRDLIGQAPQVVGYWSGLLDLIAWYPEQVPDRAALWQEAIDTHPTGAMVAGVASSIDQTGDGLTASGLLEIAWAQMPGERSLRRARKRRQLSVAFHASGDPWGLIIDPATGLPRDPEEVERIRDLPLVLEAARTRGQALEAEREAVLSAAQAALEAGDLDAAIARAGWLRVGTGELDDKDRARVHGDLHRAGTTDRAPAWMPAALVAACRASPPPAPESEG